MVYALIPARGGSKRVPRKNVAMVAGHPLLYWTIRAVFESGVVDHLVISTDDTQISKAFWSCCREEGLRTGRVVPSWVINRPEMLGRDGARSEDVFMDFVWHREEITKHPAADDDIIMLLQVTSPLRPASAIVQALDLIRTGPPRTEWQRKGMEGVCSVLSGCLVDHPVEWTAPYDGGDFWKWDENPKVKYYQRQLCQQRVRLNGAVSAATAAYLYRNRDFISVRDEERPMILLMNKYESIDIDDEIDLRICDHFLSGASGKMPRVEYPA